MSGVGEVLGWSLLHSVWQGGLVAAALWLVLRVLPSSASRARYVASVLALAGLLALPALNYRATMALWTGHRTWVLATADGIVRTELAARGRAEMGAVRAELRRRQATEWAPASSLAAAAPARDAARTFGLLWLLAVALLATRFVAEQRRAMRLAEGGRGDEGWRRSAESVAARLGIGRRVRVRLSGRVDVPALVGWRWPVVLVPTAAAGLAEAEREAVLAHELAHVARGDYLANFLQTAAEALLFYSPAAWWVSARIREERECCCDATAVGAVGGGAARYVRALLSLETGRTHTGAALALTGGPLLRRVQRIHARARDPREAAAAWALGALGLACALTIGTAALTPDVAARRAAGGLMAGDIEGIRLVAVAGPAGIPASIAAPTAASRPTPAECDADARRSPDDRPRA